MANVFGRVMVATVSQRLFRTCWLLASWPQSIAAVLGSEHHQASTLARFKQDWKLYSALEERCDRQTWEETLYARSVFRTRPCLQLQQCLAASDYNMTPSIKALVEERLSGLWATQIVEDVNGVQKNCAQLKACRRYRRPATLHAHAVAAGVTHKRHRFTLLAGVSPPMLGHNSLPCEAYAATEEACSIDTKPVATCAARTPWFSPGPPNLHTPMADCFMLRQLASIGAMHEVGKAWIGQICSDTHAIIVGVIDPRKDTTAPSWYYPLHHWQASGCLMWPVHLEQCQFSHHTCVVFRNEAMPEIIAVTSLTPERFKVSVLEWHSWLWQCREVPAATRLVPGVRPFLVPGQTDLPIMHACCHCAFWQLSRTVIAEFAEAAGVRLPAGSDLFVTLWAVIEQTLGTSEEETLAIIHRRLTNTPGGDDLSETLLQMDECTDLLDKTDVGALAARKNSVQRNTDAREELAKAYTRKVAERKARASEASGSGGRSGRKQKQPVIAKGHLTDFDVDQPTAKSYLPPRCSIWRDRTKGGWQAHHHDFKHISVRFQPNVTQAESLRFLLQRLWRMHFEKNGGGIEDCPFTGMFD